MSGSARVKNKEYAFGAGRAELSFPGEATALSYLRPAWLWLRRILSILPQWLSVFRWPGREGPAVPQACPYASPGGLKARASAARRLRLATDPGAQVPRNGMCGRVMTAAQ